MIKPGFYTTSLAKYHESEGVSKSTLAPILPPGSPRKCKWEMDHPEALDIFDLKAEKYNRGTGFHLYFQEHDKYLKECVIIPSFSGTGSKAARESFQEGIRKSGRTPLKQTVIDQIKGIEVCLESGYYETAKGILFNPDNTIELSAFWQDKESGLLCKTRPDIIASNVTLWDIKTHTKGILNKFTWQKRVMDLDYDLQGYMALEGCTRVTKILNPPGVIHEQFGHIVFDITEEPYDIQIFLMDDKMIESGRQKFLDATELFAECQDSGKWPAGPDEIEILSPPDWRLKQMEYREKGGIY